LPGNCPLGPQRVIADVAQQREGEDRGVGDSVELVTSSLTKSTRGVITVAMQLSYCFTGTALGH